jgi:hypothetical protein
MGLRVRVYRPAGGGDGSNGGISSSCDYLTVVNIVNRPQKADGAFDEPSAEAPPVLLLPGPGAGPNPILRPAILKDGKWVPEERPGTAGAMSGGNYAGVSGSAWTDAIRALGGVDLARVHDRFDSDELYERLAGR